MANDEDGGQQVAPSNHKELCNALYASCATHSTEKEFTQQDILALNVIPNGDMKKLQDCLQQLAQDGLLKMMTKEGQLCWRVVKKEDAARYNNLNIEEAMVYSYIEGAGREGIWTRIIRNRTNLHQVVFNRCLKSLESKSRIKSIQSAKFPKRKVYILAHLQPSEDVTGGPFYTDGVLDEEFVHQIGAWAERYVLGRSWYHPTAHSSDKKRKKLKIPAEEALALKDKEFKGPIRAITQHMLPMPPGYMGYPTIPEITKAVNASGVSGVLMKEAEMRQLMETLCWDNRVTKAMGGKGYKTVRNLRMDDLDMGENALTEAPCGRCPVFDLCEEGGPVNARTCTYFQDWLEI